MIILINVLDSLKKITVHLAKILLCFNICLVIFSMLMVNCKSVFLLKLASCTADLLGPSFLCSYALYQPFCQRAGVHENNYFNNQTVMFTLLAWLFGVELMQRNEMHSLNV